MVCGDGHMLRDACSCIKLAFLVHDSVCNLIIIPSLGYPRVFILGLTYS